MRLLSKSTVLADPTPVPEPERFSGEAFSASIQAGSTSTVTTALIRMRPCVRGHWHFHADGQIIHVVSGRGFVGRRDQAPLAIEAGDTVHIEAGEEHWHGAADDVELAQIAVNLGPITWLEPST